VASFDCAFWAEVEGFGRPSGRDRSENNKINGHISMKNNHHSPAPSSGERQAARAARALRYTIVTLSVPLLLAVGVEQGQAATCAFDGATISSLTKNSTSCSIDRALTIGTPNGNLVNDTSVTLSIVGSLTNNGQLENFGTIANSGSLIDSGRISGSGILNNTGSLAVDAGGSVNIGASQNLAHGTLTGGTWVVDTESQSPAFAPVPATLTVGSGKITTNDANVQLIGPGASFAQLNGLDVNNGSLAIGGQSFALQFLRNTGTVSALSGGTVLIRNSANLANATLTGGTWIVDSQGGQKATLVVGNGLLNTNDATIKLYGSQSTFAGLGSLAKNSGTLIVGNGANLALNSTGPGAALINSGTLNTLSGGSIYIGSRNLVTDSGAVTNDGQITVSGELSGTGTFTNSGTLAINPGGIVHIENSTNLSGGTLSGGTWLLNGTGTASSTLAVGHEPIFNNDANVAFIGGNTNFAQFNTVDKNSGSLSVGDRVYSFSKLDNSGALNVLTGGTVIIGSSSNLSRGVLSGGTWVVDSGGGQASLSIGGGVIGTNAATVVLQGSGAQFDQLNGHLHKNLGTLELSQGAAFNTSALVNDGIVQVSSGASLNVASSGSVSNGTLLGGTWLVGDRATVSLGGGPITTNDATLELNGSHITFNQLLSPYVPPKGHPMLGTFQSLGLTQNDGSLLIGNLGVGLVDANLVNSGTLTLDSGAYVQGSTYSSTSASSQTILSGGRLAENSIVLDKGRLSGTGSVIGGEIQVKQPATVEATSGLLYLGGNMQLNGGLVFDISSSNNFGAIELGGAQGSDALSFGPNAFMQFNFAPSFSLVDSSYSFQFLTSTYAIDPNFNNFRFHDVGGNLAEYVTSVTMAPWYNGSAWTLKLSRNDVVGSAPEPGALALAVAGLLGLLPALRRRRKRLQ
jgi:hypothetical protein